MERNGFMQNYIALDRQFYPIKEIKSLNDAEELDVSIDLEVNKVSDWKSLLNEYRTVILAEAGAGKTVEFKEMARALSNKGYPSFFIRIEDIDRNFDDAFEIGDEDEFEDWLNSNDEAWFFLDSVDEAKLSHPRAFEKAILRFAKGVEKGAKRAHIYISSRPYSWRAKSDKALIDSHLFYPSTRYTDNDEKNKNPKSALNVYGLEPLNQTMIRTYCIESGTENIEILLDEVDRLGLWNLAERPFDLDIIITKWLDDQSLDGRLYLLQHSIDVRLSEGHSHDRNALNLNKAREGAERLAAAVILTRNAGIKVPDASMPEKKGIDAKTILYDWEPKDVETLLECGLFNDIIYGEVRFRHRDVRELLAAQFFSNLLKEECLRSEVDSYFIKESFGETVITPLLRPILPWLILISDRLRKKILDVKPEIAFQGGDPSQLSPLIRKKVLYDVIAQIAHDTSNDLTLDNVAIAQFAQPDIAEDILDLVSKYEDNDYAISFLSRLVSQGNMEACVEPFIGISASSKRDEYTRILSVRAVFTCGSEKQKTLAWQEIISSKEIPINLLREMVSYSSPDKDSIQYLIELMPRVTHLNESEKSLLDLSLIKFIEQAEIQLIPDLLKGLGDYLGTAPFIEKRECRVSKQYSYLICSAIKCLEKLVLKRDSFALSDLSLSIMANVSAFTPYHDEVANRIEHDLHDLVPEWKELNDALYWHSIKKVNEYLSEKNRPLTYAHPSFLYSKYFWSFNRDDFSRLLSFASDRIDQCDRLAALSTAFSLYQQLGSPANMLDELRKVVLDKEVMASKLDDLLGLTVLKSKSRFDIEEQEYFRKVEKKQKEKERKRIEWIKYLKENPSLLASPSGKSGEITNAHASLLRELENKSLAARQSDQIIPDFVLQRANSHKDLKNESSPPRRQYASQWELLIPDFGIEVAKSYKEFCVNHWQNFRPHLRSEGASNSSIPIALILGLAGTEIQANEDPDFPRSLSAQNLENLLRYITWEMNGFPGWLTVVHENYSEETNEAILKEIFWELERSSKAKGISSNILHNLVYHAPWATEHLARPVFDHLLNSDNLIQANKEYCLKLLIKGGISPDELSSLSKKYISASQSDDSEMAWWHALLVNSEPGHGIAKLDRWLATLDTERATNAAEEFLVGLFSKRPHHPPCDLGLFQSACHLKDLYILMHKYVRTCDDRKKFNGSIASFQTRRDDAQEARDMLLNHLLNIESKESYCALLQLAEKHPNERYRPRMKKLAYKMAETCGNMEPWSDERFNKFHQTKMIYPETNRELFNRGVLSINSIKEWVENGNDSPWVTWQRAEKENEVRTLIAAELRKSAKGCYTISEESELANEQRMDISLYNPNTKPVPIELKLLDKRWSGSDLCWHLKNQLVGDYLREGEDRCGIFLLVSLKSEKKKWEVDGERVGIDKLALALKNHWKSVSHDYTDINEIEVIVIDMNKRALANNSKRSRRVK